MTVETSIDVRPQVEVAVSDIARAATPVACDDAYLFLRRMAKRWHEERVINVHRWLCIIAAANRAHDARLSDLGVSHG